MEDTINQRRIPFVAGTWRGRNEVFPQSLSGQIKTGQRWALQNRPV
jgi:hypothetical protein